MLPNPPRVTGDECPELGAAPGRYPDDPPNRNADRPPYQWRRYPPVGVRVYPPPATADRGTMRWVMIGGWVRAHQAMNGPPRTWAGPSGDGRGMLLLVTF